MNVEQIMTPNAACCGRGTTLRDCAQLMLKNDCGAIPVTENEDGSGNVVGVITDRDIVCRAVAKGMDVNLTTVDQCMTPSPATVSPGTNLKEAERTMSELRVRRIPVVSEGGVCVGMLSQADIALTAPNDDLAEVVKKVSQPYMA